MTEPVIVLYFLQGAFADEDHPLASQGPWLHVYLSHQDIEMILKDISVLDDVSG